MNKETMMESMIKLPDDMFRLELLPYLTVQDIVNLDKACMNHKYRSQLMDKISGVILLGDKDRSIKASLFRWLGMRRIYFTKMLIVVSDFNLTPSSIENDYVDQFRYTQHVVLRGSIKDDMAMFIISHCPFLLSIDIGDYEGPDPLVTDHTLQSIAKHCSGRLQSLSLICCRSISDSGLITISMHCHDLQSLDVMGCDQMGDASIISVSTHCTGLQSFNLNACSKITDASIISISTHCTGLLSLHLDCCDKITDASIISISENCKVIKELIVSFTNITDASLIAIAKNCTGLKLLKTGGCNGLSSYNLRNDFRYVFQRRAVLLSIYPSLPI
jgi:hypothetical protein